MDPEKLPVPLPPEPESPKGFKALLQHQRFILVTLVVLLFFGILFGLGLYRKAKTVTPGETAKVEAAKPLEAKAPEPLLPHRLKLRRPLMRFIRPRRHLPCRRLPLRLMVRRSTRLLRRKK